MRQIAIQIHVESKAPAVRCANTIEPSVSVWNEPLKCSRSFVTIEGTAACQICWLHLLLGFPLRVTVQKWNLHERVQYVVRVGGISCCIGLFAHK